MAKAARAPWKRPNPRKRAGKTSKHLSPEQKSAAKARARRAGRPYPNLVDNMASLTKGKSRKAARKPARKAASRRKRASRSARTTSRKRTIRAEPETPHVTPGRA
jgi:hypothetical protein